MDTSEKKYYDRHLKLDGFGTPAQEKLLQAKVLVIGAGGLGCPLLQYLTTAGIGTIGVVDGDTIALSNLHRQILYNPEDVGLSKAETAVKKLKQLQPSIDIKAYCFNLTNKNAAALFAKYDLIIDGTDNFATRYLVNDACVLQHKPLVSGAIQGYMGQVSVFNYLDGPTYRCLYPEVPDEDDCSSCSINGVLNVLPGIVALYMANEAIKVISGYGDVLSGKLLLIDIQKNEHRILHFDAMDANKHITSLDTVEDFLSSAEAIRYQAMDQTTQLIDVREPWEYEEHNIGGINIPLHDLLERRNEIDLHNPIIFICQSGKRSRMARHLLNLSESSMAFSARLD